MNPEPIEWALAQSLDSYNLFHNGYRDALSRKWRR